MTRTVRRGDTISNPSRSPQRHSAPLCGGLATWGSHVFDSHSCLILQAFYNIVWTPSRPSRVAVRDFLKYVCACAHGIMGFAEMLLFILPFSFCFSQCCSRCHKIIRTQATRRPGSASRTPDAISYRREEWQTDRQTDTVRHTVWQTDGIARPEPCAVSFFCFWWRLHCSAPFSCFVSGDISWEFAIRFLFVSRCGYVLFMQRQNKGKSRGCAR